MHAFFHGWRRKAAVVTLVLACAVFAMWMRSYCIHDRFCTIESNDVDIIFDSTNGAIVAQRLTLTKGVVGLSFLRTTEDLGKIHYSAVVLPLNLLSAYLLLAPVRKRPPTASKPDA